MIIKQTLAAIYSLILFCSVQISVGQDDVNDVAKVILLKGHAVGKMAKDGSEKDLVLGQWIKEGTLITTKEKSFVKLLFLDKSQINIGPSSQMRLVLLRKGSPGLVNLLKGVIRSQVSKDYMNMTDGTKSKFIVRTKNTAMGVRGTDFMVNYDFKKEETTLSVWEGTVSIVQFNPKEIGNFDLSTIDYLLTTKGSNVEAHQQAEINPTSPPKIQVEDMSDKKEEIHKTFQKIEGTAPLKTEDLNEMDTKKMQDFVKHEIPKDIVPPGVVKSEFSNHKGETPPPAEQSKELSQIQIPKPHVDPQHLPPSAGPQAHQPHHPGAEELQKHQQNMDFYRSNDFEHMRQQDFLQKHHINAPHVDPAHIMQPPPGPPPESLPPKIEPPPQLPPPPPSYPPPPAS